MQDREMEGVLLKRACAGEMDALAELRTLLEPPLRRFIRRLIGMHENEEDILQGVFIALYQQMHRIDPVEHLRPYLFRIARNRCYDTLRAQGRFRAVSLDDEPMEIVVSFAQAEATPDPEDVAHWLLLHLEVREAMLRLPELQRQTLILYAEEEMTYAEIATAMGTNIGTVKSRLHHAKRRLRALLRVETVAALDEAFDEQPEISR